MDEAVLLIFALFFAALFAGATSGHGPLRTSVRRPRLFRLVVVLAAAVTVPVDLYAVGYGTVGPSGVAASDVAGRLLLLNVAASCGVAALHASLRGPAVSTGAAADESSEAEHPVRMGVLGWSGPLIALVAVTAVIVLGSRGGGPEFGDVGSVWVAYCLPIGVISAFALHRRRAVGVIDPQEG